MPRKFIIPILGSLTAIAITSVMDFTGLSVYSALPLFPLLIVFSVVEKIRRRELGFCFGKWSDYCNAALYPVVTLGVLTLIALLIGVVDTRHTDWRKALINLIVAIVATVLIAIITEEGFFRGWLWASLARRGASPWATLFITSIVFAAWHLSAVTFNTGFDVPARQIPIFITNAAVMGANWGVLRMRSRSIIVSSVSHGIWNGLAYVLFGFGVKTGALGIVNTSLYGPEVGIVGLSLNSIFLAATLLIVSFSTRKSEVPQT